MAGWAVVYGIFGYAEHFWVLELSKPGIEKWMKGYNVLLDLSFWIMLDLLGTAGQCRVVMAKWLGGILEWKEKWLLYVPSFVVFPALLYIHICLFYLIPGMDFGWGTVFFAVGVFIVVAGGACLLKKYLSSLEIRLELTAVWSFLLFLMTVCSTIFHPSMRVFVSGQPIDWLQTLKVVGVLLIFPLIGYLFRKKRCRGAGKYKL